MHVYVRTNGLRFSGDLLRAQTPRKWVNMSQAHSCTGKKEGRYMRSSSFVVASIFMRSIRNTPHFFSQHGAFRVGFTASSYSDRNVSRMQPCELESGVAIGNRQARGSARMLSNLGNLRGFQWTTTSSSNSFAPIAASSMARYWRSTVIRTGTEFVRVAAPAMELYQRLSAFTTSRRRL
jgi:hypothetical protein